MKFNEARKIVEHLKKFEAEISSMQTILSVEAKNHFVKSFRDGGFTDENLVHWQKRKRGRDNQGRAILVKTGRLKRSIVANKIGRYAVRISSNLPYAKIHNDGGIINKKERSHTLNFSSKGRFQIQRTKRQRNETSYSQKVNIAAHTIKMPKRQFVGYSGVLSRKIATKLDKKIQAIFK